MQSRRTGTINHTRPTGTVSRPDRSALVPASPDTHTTTDGLRHFAVHADDPRLDATLWQRDSAPTASTAMKSIDPETAARRYLALLISGSDADTCPVGPATRAVTFVLQGTETVALTGARVVRFAEHYRGTAVYGSLVTVELEPDNALLTIHAALGWPDDVDPVATISPAQAIAAAAAAPDTPDEPPTLYYYHDNHSRPARWRLVYLVAGVPTVGKAEAGRHAPDLADYVVDAHTGAMVAQLPRVQTGQTLRATLTARNERRVHPERPVARG
jgi:hypothetical protein